MQPIRIEVRLPYRDVDELDGALAERVTATALFVPFRQAPVEVDVGTWVRVELALDDGSVALGVDGVAAWRYPDGAVPVGHEAGLGVAVVSVDLAHRTRFAALVARAGAGTRARVPGQRLLLRQRLPGAALPPLPARAPVWTHETLPPSSTPPPQVVADGLDRLAVLANALASADDDATVDGTSAPPSSTENPSSSGPTAANADASSLETAAALLASPFLEGATPAEGGSALLDSAELPFVLPVEQAFERRSTDVDLLASLSAQDLVSLHEEPVAPSEGELPSVDAEFVDELVDGGLDVRALPAPEPATPGASPAPHGVIGVAFTLGPRGLVAVEPVAWAPTGSRRLGSVPMESVPMEDVEVDTGAFALATGPADGAADDPFAPRVTDPALGVDGLVARAVAAAHEGDIDSDGVFGSSDHTGDGQPVAIDIDLDATRSAEAARAPSSDDTGESQGS